MDEIWKNVVVKGEIYDNYKVSNLGRIISLNYRNTGKAELMKTIERKDGYLQACFSKNNKIVTYPWHRIVAEAFLPNLENKPYIIGNRKKNNIKKIFFVIFILKLFVDINKVAIPLYPFFIMINLFFLQLLHCEVW